MGRRNAALVESTKTSAPIKAIEQETFDVLRRYEDMLMVAGTRRLTRQEQNEMTLARQDVCHHIKSLSDLARACEEGKRAFAVAFRAYRSAAEQRFAKIEILDPGYLDLIDNIEVSVEPTID